MRIEHGPTLLARARRMPGGDVSLVLEDVSELRRLQRIRTEFIDNISHELRTPLTTVSLLAETLAADADTLSRRRPRSGWRRSRSRPGTSCRWSTSSSISRGSKSGIADREALDDVDLGRLAVETTDRLRVFAERQGVALVVRAPELVPVVPGDPTDRSDRVLLNLLHRDG